MTVLRNKRELVALLQDPVFSAILSARGEFDLNKIDRGLADELEYVDSSAWDFDEDEYTPDGHHLFETPLKGNGSGPDYGTTLYVIKLYGGELPFRVEASEHAPWGNGEEPNEHLGDFRTLEEAVDHAFHAYEQGDLSLSVMQENDETGGYTTVRRSVFIPESAGLHDAPHL